MRARGGAEVAAGRSVSRDATSTTSAEAPRGAAASWGSSEDEVEVAVGTALGPEPTPAAEPATVGVATSGLPAGNTADVSGSDPRSRERSACTSAAEPGTAAAWLSGAERAGASACPVEEVAAGLARSSLRWAIARLLCAALVSEFALAGPSPRAERPGAGASS
ncbi:MAG TPA: hypothetical protein VFD71_14560, partial [Planctomycetota bacterium]|nr:hypothetical protein [Planctomycetota bacterium]